MRIAVTGTKGQLVSSLRERAAELADVELVVLGRPVVDLARTQSIFPAIKASGTDLIINAAAYTEVDKAESEAEAAFAINAVGAEAVAAAANQLGLPVFQVSTDYVFDGTANGDYLETAPTGPVSVYGASKLAGEVAVAAANPKHLIVRTAWVYSPFGKNFVKTMLRLAAERDTLRIVDDQVGNPTSALDLADGLLAAARVVLKRNFNAWGIFHMTGAGSVSWAGFASHVLAESARFGGPYAKIEPIAGSEFVTAAKRPSNSRLDCGYAEKELGYRASDWRVSVSTVVQKLLTED